MIQNLNEELFSFIKKSPTGFHAVHELANYLTEAGFECLSEGNTWNLVEGGKYFVTRNQSAIIAFKVSRKDYSGFHIAASHSDSPTLKIKESSEMNVENQYVKLNVEKYGGMLCAPWFDRPLSVAGRIIVKDGNRLTKAIAFGNGTKHLLCNQPDDFTLTDGQSADVGLTGNQCGDDCVMVGYLFAVADLLRQNYRRCSFITDTGRADNNSVHAVCHIIGEITAVGSWVCAEFLFIETLHIIEGLLCGVAKLSVGISLECSQVVECRSFFCFLFTRNGLYHNWLIVLGDNRFCFGLLFEFLAHGCESAKVQLCGVKRFGLERFNFGFSLNEQSESGRNHTPDIQGAVVQHGEQTGRIDADEPVRPLTTACGGKEIFVLLAVFQFMETLFNGVVLHRGNPKPIDGLLTSGHLVDVAEDKLALTPGVAGVDNIGYISTVHQLFQRFKLAVFCQRGFCIPHRPLGLP